LASATGRLVHLELVCSQQPPRVYDGLLTEFGLQDKQLVLHPGDLRPDGTTRFELSATARDGSDGIRFSGPFVHGPADGKFLYLGWRPLDGPADGWIRRWKLSLTEIPRATIGSLGDDETLSARVMDADVHASVWLKSDWTINAAVRR